jgi:diketogulonate reductase-like aldo/keto reductase
MNDPQQFQPRRELGRTGFNATALGIGDLADRNIPLDICVDTIQRALDAGLNVIDTAPGYEDGYSEQIVGEALEGHLIPQPRRAASGHHGRPVRYCHVPDWAVRGYSLHR